MKLDTFQSILDPLNLTSQVQNESDRMGIDSGGGIQRWRGTLINLWSNSHELYENGNETGEGSDAAPVTVSEFEWTPVQVSEWLKMKMESDKSSQWTNDQIDSYLDSFN